MKAKLAALGHSAAIVVAAHLVERLVPALAVGMIAAAYHLCPAHADTEAHRQRVAR